VTNFKVLHINQSDADNIDPKLESHPDPLQIFQKLFFRFPFPCGSIIAIAPDGRYASYLGEYGANTPYYLLKTLLKNKDNKKWISAKQ
jgi:hypothetical protein